MRLISFLLRYFRHYMAWAIVAAGAALLYAGLTAGIVALIEPVFGEVLLAGDQTPSVLGALGDMDGSEEVEDSNSRGEDLADRGKRFADKFQLKDWLDTGYENLKRRFHVNSDNVVYFLPILVVIVFLMRSLSNFVSTYSFQRIGLGVTNDLRNDLYRQVLTQSSRFHADHPSGELISRIVNDIGMMQNVVSYRLWIWCSSH